MITGSIELWQVPKLRPMCNVWSNPMPLESENNKDFQQYFTEMGYKIDWDFSSRSGQSWWELYEEGQLVVQIDRDVPLKDILEDICQFHLGKDGTSKTDYTVSGNGPRMKNFFKRVYENCNNRSSN